MKSKAFSCYDCDGSNIDFFRYCIGQINTYDQGIPGPIIMEGDKEVWTQEKWVKLWIRVPISRYTCKLNMHHNQNLLLTMMLIILLLSCN